MRCLFCFLLLVPVLFFMQPAQGYARKHRSPTWQNCCSRLIYTGYRGTINTPVHLDTTLTGLLWRMSRAHKLSAYYGGAELATQYPASFFSSGYVRFDTTITENPLTEKTDTALYGDTIYYLPTGEWKTLEEWTFYEATGKLKVKLLGIAPLIKEMENGHERAKFPVWYRWNDVQDIALEYSATHHQEDLFHAFMISAAGPDIDSTGKKHGRCLTGMRQITLTWDRDDEPQYRLLEERERYNELADTITKGVLQGHIHAYELARRYANGRIPVPRTDTVTDEDPVTGLPITHAVQIYPDIAYTMRLKHASIDTIKDMVKTTYFTHVVSDPYTDKVDTENVRHPFGYESIRFYSMLHKCTAARDRRSLDISIKAIAPVEENYDFPHGRRTMYWIKYADILPYFHYLSFRQPQQNFPYIIWKNIFGERIYDRSSWF
jgi:hypothetical protein